MSPAWAVAEPAPNNGVSAAALALLGERNPRIRRALTAYLIGEPIFKAARTRYKTLRAGQVYTVSVNGTASIYPDVHEWLLEQIPSNRRRSLAAQTSNSSPHLASPHSESESKDRLTLRYDGSRSQTLHLNGHKISVEVEKSQWNKNSDDGPMPAWLLRDEKIIFTATTLAGRDAILTFLEDVVARKQLHPPHLFIADQWGSWNRHQGSIVRSLDSVVLAAGLKEQLVDDLGDFLTNETAYARLGFPYHRGYLFHGPPGTGKTSFAKALAAHFHLDVYYVPLPMIANDGVLVNLLQRVSTRSMLLLEDIDAVRASLDREKQVDVEHAGVTLTGLLNALDGVVTPHGMVMVMTTNRHEVLDAALTRRGRVDHEAEFGLLDQDQLERIVQTFLDQPGDDLPQLEKELSPAEALEAIKANMRDPAAARKALEGLIRDPIRLLRTPVEVSE